MEGGIGRDREREGEGRGRERERGRGEGEGGEREGRGGREGWRDRERWREGDLIMIIQSCTFLIAAYNRHQEGQGTQRLPSV